MLHAMFEAGFDWLAARLAHRHWRWGLAALCLLVAAMFQFPKVNHAYAQLFAHTEVLDEKLRRISEQIAAPFAQHADESTTHLAKMSFRLTVPLLARVLHLPLAALLGLQVLAGFVVFHRRACSKPACATAWRRRSSRWGWCSRTSATNTPMI